MRRFEEAVDALHTVAYRVAFRMTGGDPDAQDVAQETAARAMVCWPKIEPYAEAWVARCAANLVIDRVRLAHRRTNPAAEVAVPVGPERVALVEALRRLPRRQREVLVLRYLADLSEREVAVRLGCSVGTVNQHARRGLMTLRNGPELSAEGRG